MLLGLIVNDPEVEQQSLSTFEIGFSVSAVSPIQSSYEVRVSVGAFSVLESSIVHNLPKLQTSPAISCRYVLPDIVCVGVDAFYFANYRYFVRGRGYFTINDDLSIFGDVSIVSVDQLSNLFVGLTRNMSIKTVLNSDYHDYGGLHGG
jgi:hypothetical protein